MPLHHEPREQQGYECDHMRPVVWLGDGWHHVIYNGLVGVKCEAGVYEVTVTYTGDHPVSKLMSNETGKPLL